MIDKEEKKLIEKIKESDFDAFHSIFYHYQPILYNHILYMTNNEYLTEDIIQETFYRVWIHRKSLKLTRSFYGYINKISSNLLKDYYKHEKVKIKDQETLSLSSKSEKDDPEEAFNVTILNKEIKNAVNKYLPGKCRTIFILSRIEGKSNDEIAQILKIR